MNRRNFIENISLTGIGAFGFPRSWSHIYANMIGNEASADVVILGGGLGGCAAALAACRNGLKVILTEETDWIGGQLSQQGVPPDEHPWIETYGAPQSYREFRTKVRDFYRQHYPLTKEAKANPLLNPGNGAVSRLCHEPRVGVAVLTDMLAQYLSNGQLTLLLDHKVQSAETEADRILSVTVRNLRSNNTHTFSASYFIDATELGDLLPLAKVEYVTGSEARSDTKELHAGEIADPTNHQAFTLCFAMDYEEGADHTIDRPRDYDHWQNYVPQMSPPWADKLLDLNYSSPQTLKPKNLGFHPKGVKTGDMLNLWNYRRMIHHQNFVPGTYGGDITLVNWPQNDYFPGNIIDVDDETVQQHIEGATQLNLSLLYWLQTEAPRPNGGYGWKGIRLRKDIMGTEDGMAKYPYVRESRRIQPVFRILEEHVGKENRARVAGSVEGQKAAHFFDSVGTGYYHIDLHPSTGGDNYIDFPSLPFQIPLGALLPQRVENMFPANKNIGTTHITNGCYRLHPVEWSIGEAVGMLVCFAKKKKVVAKAVRENEDLLQEFQTWIRSQGLETEWREN